MANDNEVCVCVCVCVSVCVLVAQLYLALCCPMDCNLPGFCVHGMFQARILECVAFSSPRDLPDSETEPGSPAL